MNVIKKIISVIFNPLNNVFFKGNDKTAEVFKSNNIFIFFISLLVSAVIFVLCYFVI